MSDKSWTDYISEQFEGNWDADHTDYVKVLTEQLDDLNKTHGPLFRKISHPGLHVPVLNSPGKYIAAHKELYKLVGADNVVLNTVKDVLRAVGFADGDFMNDGGPPKGSWALLRMLAENKGCDWSPFATVADNRHKDSHRIQDDAGTGEYYPSRFREDLKKLILELQRLR